ncbi:RidA family protein [Microbacterium sp.]|uniref:RidA family protein n=1 Tax=Microbacterium sp. TaxID=51671 RepID=UPI003C74917B
MKNWQYIGHENTPTGYGFHMAAGIRAGQQVFVSGAAAIGEGGKVPAELIGDVAGQTRATLDEIDRILREAGGSLHDGIKFTVFLPKTEYFRAMNDVWNEYFVDNGPTRSTVQAGLMIPEMLVEIDAIALLDD